MPPKSKARSSKRAKAEESEGEDEQMQVAQPSSHKNRSAAVNGRKSARRARDEEMDEDAEPSRSHAPGSQEDEDIDLFDPTAFGNQPLDPAYAEKKIQSFTNDWSTLEVKLNDMITTLEGAAVAVEEYAEQDNGVRLA